MTQCDDLDITEADQTAKRGADTLVGAASAAGITAAHEDGSDPPLPLVDLCPHLG